MAGQVLCEKQEGACAGSTRICVNGEWPVCDQNNYDQYYYELLETSWSDGIDNDCDGVTDIGDNDCQ